MLYCSMHFFPMFLHVISLVNSNLTNEMKVKNQMITFLSKPQRKKKFSPSFLITCSCIPLPLSSLHSLAGPCLLCSKVKNSSRRSHLTVIYFSQCSNFPLEFFLCVLEQLWNQITPPIINSACFIFS